MHIVMGTIFLVLSHIFTPHAHLRAGGYMIGDVVHLQVNFSTNPTSGGSI